MTWVEGIGDEVIQFFIALFVIYIGTLAWLSTRITERPAIRTVFIFERRALNRSSPQHIQTPPTTTANEVETRTYTSEHPPTIEENKPPSAGTSVESNSEGASGTSENLFLTPEEEEQNTILHNMDSNCVIRRRRLEFFNQGTNTSATNSTEVSVDSVDSETSNNVTTETENTTESNFYHVEETNQTNTAPTDNNDITIKLKYINDDLKLVNGKLQEPLGDFRRRHFEPELSSNKLVKLIFNGQVLQQDNVSLQGCGFFDNCVVHCLVHQKRQHFTEQNTAEDGVGNDNTSDSNRNGLNGEPRRGSRDQAREWDLGNLFFAIVSFILGAAWYFRYEYAQLYTVTATIALVGLTGIFTVLLVGMYFPDPDPSQPIRT